MFLPSAKACVTASKAAALYTNLVQFGTGGSTTWTVPAGITSILARAFGADGQPGTGMGFRPGTGGQAAARIAVSPGDVITLYIGNSYGDKSTVTATNASLIAGGGGGAGSEGELSSSFADGGFGGGKGDGGIAGVSGGAGSAGVAGGNGNTTALGGTGGTGATTSANGTNGTSYGSVSGAGGAGGVGVFNGGSGGNGGDRPTSSDTGGGGGGGGGGSSSATGSAVSDVNSSLYSSDYNPGVLGTNRGGIDIRY